MEKPKTVDQKFHEVRAKVEACRQLFARQGTIVSAYRSYRGRRLGPYFRLVYREAGRQRSIYLGSSRELAGRVQALLEKLQRPVRQHRTYQHQRRRLIQQLREAKSAWDRELHSQGLWLKGYEIRGARGGKRGAPQA